MSMDVSSPAWSPGWKGLSLMNMVFAVMLLALPAPGLVSSCTPSINIKRNSKSSGTQGQPVSLRCPVCLCSEEWPNVTWCKVDEGPNNQCNPVKLDHQIISGWEDKKENKGVYVLKFSSVQINDTGFYKCLAAFKEQQIVGSVIQFTVSDTAMATTTPMDMLTSSNTNSTVLNIQVLKQFKIFMYVMVSVGGVCFMIIIISVLVFCYRKRQIKPGSSTHVKLTEEFVASTSPENGLERSEPSCPPWEEITTESAITTYDNASMGNRPRGSVSLEEDSIVYADLNHDAKKAHLKFQGGSEVEYATVRLNKP